MRTGDQIRAAIARVSPMRTLAATLSEADMADVAAYFVTVLGPPTNAPDFGVGGQWASAVQPWWALYVTQHALGAALSGGWLTFDAGGNAVWLYFHEAGTWTAPGVYEAALFRNTGPPFGTPPGAGTTAPRATAAGSIAFVFTDGDTAEATFVVDGHRVVHRIGRVRLPP